MELYDLLNQHLQKMDVFFGSHNNIKSFPKDDYESYLMHSFRCYKAACYHAENIEKHFNDHQKWAEGRASQVSFGSGKGLASMRMSKDVDHFAFELFAFVASLKSSLDFLFSAFNLSTKNFKKFDSITSAINYAKNTNGCDISETILKNCEWLEYLNDYRNVLLHRSSLLLKAGFHLRIKGEIKRQNVYPILIPREPPKFIVDTRVIRTFENEALTGMNHWESTWSIKKSDGTILEEGFDLEVEPAQGFIEIRDFCEGHLATYKLFYESVIRQLGHRLWAS